MSVRLGLAIAFFVGLPSAAEAYVRTSIPDQRGQPIDGTCLHWSSRQIPWSPAAHLGGNLPEDEAMRAVRLSFDEWASQSCTDLQFVERGPVAREVGYSNRGPNSNVVLFREQACDDVVPRGAPCRDEGTCANEYDCWEYDPTRLIAVTTTTFSQCTGRIVDADIEFNGSHFRFSTTGGERCGGAGGRDCVDTDVRNTLVHEVGHMIGLDHSPVARATMFSSAPSGETQKRSLDEDDIAGLCDIYPAGEATWICEPARPPAQCGEGEDTAGASRGCAAGAGELAFAGLVPAVWWAWRRRSR